MAAAWNHLLGVYRETRLPPYLKAANHQGQLAKRYGAVVWNVPGAPSWGERASGKASRMVLRTMNDDELRAAPLPSVTPDGAFNPYDGEEEEEEEEGSVESSVHEGSSDSDETSGEDEDDTMFKPPVGPTGRPRGRPRIHPLPVDTDVVEKKRRRKERKSAVVEIEASLPPPSPETPIFTSIVFRLSPQQESNLPDLAMLIKSNGGKLEDDANKAMLIVYGGMNTGAADVPVVSNLFILDCIAAGKRLPMMPYLVKSKPLEGMHITLLGDQFSMERPDLTSWIISHGGRVAAYMHSRFKLTHLVVSAGVRSAQQAPMRRARSLKIAVVSQAFLDQCVFKGIKVNEENFKVNRATYPLLEDRRSQE